MEFILIVIYTIIGCFLLFFFIGFWSGIRFANTKRKNQTISGDNDVIPTTVPFYEEVEVKNSVTSIELSPNEAYMTAS